MEKKEFAFSFEVYGSADELNRDDAALLRLAREATKKSYAPYSRFRVGAAARLLSGELVTGANQENASFPAGLCAEGVLLATASSLYPGMAIDTLAVSYDNERGPSDRPISPCGICRQSLQEFEQRTGRPVRLIMGGREGKVYVIPQASLLLPLAFSGDELA
ncbi:MAG: cytidine deaminase [Bacteroidota bacterium]|nr:cytidine deaminase [Bacteroidota bacterium]MDP4217978.1 cytidine deaminase [Bacteroidota bacterium]MDP4247087.1 cytidine deaminase [Bacteroidota bacterium]MDP4259695.1 cytidine deaminase [Bacteroidota bacterium]